MRHSTHGRQQGFSLTELSIALAIIAVILGSAVSVLITGDYEAKKSQTELKMERINEALSSFLAIYKRLPCPALPGVAPTNAKFGEEVITPNYDRDAPTFCENSEDAIAMNTAGRVTIGAVPVVTLGLPDDYISDGWGNRFLYAVDADFVLSETHNANCGYAVMTDDCFALADESADADITVYGKEGVTKTTDAVYALISFGANGHGAYPGYGGAERINAYTEDSPYYLTGSDELENAELTSDGTDAYETDTFDAEFVQKELTDRRDEAADTDRLYFDDFVQFRTKAQLIADIDISSADEFGLSPKLYEPVCLYADEVLSNPSSNRCSGAADYDSCQKFAVALEERCL